MKYIVVANDVCHVEMLANIGIESIVVSSKYSSYRNAFSLAQIKSCLSDDYELIVSFYDLIGETIIEEVTDYIDELLKIGVGKFIVNDLGIINYLLSCDVEVIYDNITVNTNYETLDILGDIGIFAAVLGREITLNEINEIENSTSINTVVHVQGMFPIFTSIRKLITNYSKARDMKEVASDYALYQKDRNAKYPIIEKDSGVVMFSSYEQCSIEDIDKLSSKMLLIDQPLVENSTNIEVVKMYLNHSKYCIDDVSSISEYRQSRGFFYKKTMYKL